MNSSVHTLTTSSPITKTMNNNFAAKALNRLYLDSTSADVHFVFGADTEQPIKVPAHKSILGAMSPIFHTMFYGLLKEGDEVKIDDAPAEAFKKFLQFFYLIDVSLSLKDISRIMYLCEKYQINDCLQTCSTFLGDILSVDAVCLCYELAFLFKQPQLVKTCDAFIKFETSTILKSDGFLCCNKDVLQHILNMDSLNCSPADVLVATLKWAQHSTQANDLSADNPKDVRDQLGDLFFKLPFGALDPAEFFKAIPLYKDLFLFEEMKDIIGIIGSEAYQPTIFVRRNFCREKNESNQPMEVNRIISDSFLVNDVETTTFSSNKLLLLNGFLCANVYNFVKEKWAYYILEADFPSSKITIGESQNMNDTILFSGEIKLITHGENRVNLASPIIIRPFVKYEIRFKQPGIPPSIYTFSTLKSELRIEPDITIQFHPDPNLNFDNTATGLITTLFVEPF
ncbi:BTB/POZ domain-containing protein 6-B-like [Contarinia nasturtii]|uniref:BTB/POZ domain-containing protein 6-B-like n=1 Tax=Contarinia nasturtii TaxID=265458 RepID=UPI0012D3E8E5|nr:BTB/POZ domain-containing protein 6-B-like [Contarinia nasturtii]